MPTLLDSIAAGIGAPKPERLMQGAPLGNQAVYEATVRDAMNRRGRHLTEAELEMGARTMGADDPYPVGLQFSNQSPIPRPATRAEIERANMREASAAKAAKVEAAVKAYESGVERKIAGRARMPSASETNRNSPWGIAARMKAGEAVSPDELIRGYRYINMQARLKAEKQAKDAQLVQLIKTHDAGRTPRDFRRSMMMGDARSARAYLEARKLELAQEDAAGDRDLRREGLGIQRDEVDLRRDFGLEQLKNQGRSLKLEESGLAARERMHGQELSGRERMALQQVQAQHGAAAARMLFERMMAGDRRGHEQDMFDRQLKGQRDLVRDQRGYATEDRVTGLRDAILRGALSSENEGELREKVRMMPALNDLIMGKVPTMPAPKLVGDTLDPTLKRTWNELAGAPTDANSLGPAAFLESLPLPDIRNNREALKQYFAFRYPNTPIDRVLTNPWYNMRPSTISRVNERREALGQAPTHWYDEF